ncbi:MAG TPA: GGDEF domain-containing protein, partial [Kiloniellales bacterium]|nr:GGDEF domain-containing protein [Kiloniellales bacterium]
ARRDRTKAALLFLDLDGFKAVNDRLGHDAGDAVLKEVAVRLSAGMRATDSVMRIGGDEFLVLLTDVRDNATVAWLAGKLIEAIRAPFHCCPETVSIRASIGIAVFPDHDMTAEELIKRADAAMYAVKQECKNGYRFA